ncbi:MAG TPA: hypothetical protein VMZ30_09045, partial [Pyrinomonadaceae bacterium]|nr:hypothetical protein [Pyrinomonadaceae bacterium]
MKGSPERQSLSALCGGGAAAKIGQLTPNDASDLATVGHKRQPGTTHKCLRKVGAPKSILPV